MHCSGDAPAGSADDASYLPRDFEVRLVDRTSPGDGRRLGMGGRGLPERHARAAGRLRGVSTWRARQAGGRGRPSPTPCPKPPGPGRLDLLRRGGIHHGRAGGGPARRPPRQAVSGGQQDRHAAGQAAAVRASLQPARLHPHGRSVLARVPVPVRVLRHHRDLRPRAPHQGARAGPGRARRSQAEGLRGYVSWSTTTSSGTRRRPRRC
jgi:hypothetical protein